MDARVNGWLDSLTGVAWSGYRTTTSYFLNYQTVGGQVTWDVVFHGIMNSGSRPVSPLIAGFTPAFGKAGDTVILTGENLTGVTEVRFNNVPASSFVVIDDAQITVTVPAMATSGPISVFTAGASGVSQSDFTVAQITAFAPAQGSMYTAVQLTGSGFSGTTKVAFNRVSAYFSVYNDNSIWTWVPYGASDGPITVTTPVGTLVSAADFTVIGIVSVSPEQSASGLPVVITGRGFSGATAVEFISRPAASFKVDSDTQITAVVPKFLSSGWAIGGVTVTTPAQTFSGPMFTIVTQDLDLNGTTDLADMALLAASFGRKSTDADFPSLLDLNGDGVIDEKDILIFYAGL
jgi:hypothetical protein